MKREKGNGEEWCPIRNRSLAVQVGVSKSSTRLSVGLRHGLFTCVGWQVTSRQSKFDTELSVTSFDTKGLKSF